MAGWGLNLLSRGRLRARAERWRACLGGKDAGLPELYPDPAPGLAIVDCCFLLQPHPSGCPSFLVPVCFFFGSGGRLEQALAVAAVQSCIVLGSNAAPLPGAMGVADYLFLDGYCALVQDPVSMELASRGISFYGCFVLCGLILLAGVLASGIYRKREVP